MTAWWATIRWGEGLGRVGGKPEGWGGALGVRGALGIPRRVGEKSRMEGEVGRGILTFQSSCQLLAWMWNCSKLKVALIPISIYVAHSIMCNTALNWTTILLLEIAQMFVKRHNVSVFPSLLFLKCRATCYLTALEMGFRFVTWENLKSVKSLRAELCLQGNM